MKITTMKICPDGTQTRLDIILVMEKFFMMIKMGRKLRVKKNLHLHNLFKHLFYTYFVERLDLRTCKAADGGGVYAFSRCFFCQELASLVALLLFLKYILAKNHDNQLLWLRDMRSSHFLINCVFFTVCLLKYS